MSNKMNFTALDDIAAQMDKYGVNGDVELMNGLDESILNAIGTKSYGGASYGGSSAFTNESLLDGMTENTSLLNVDGDNSTTTKTDAKLTDLAKKEYEKSGSKKPFRDWLNSERGRNAINTAAQIANLFVSGQAYQQQQQQQDTKTTTSQQEDTKNKPAETTILGMSPITFGIVALGLVAVGSVVVIKLIKSKK